GLGVVVSFSGFPYIRGYNRIGIYINFFSVFALVLLLDRFRESLAATRWRWLVPAALPLLLGVGLYTQSGKYCSPAFRADREVFYNDREFAQRIESALPPYSQVFQLPCIAYPESVLPGDLCGYEMAKPYLHTKTLRWSYGAGAAQDAMRWQEIVREKP